MAEDDTRVNPAGSVSATETPVALFGPLFRTETVNVTLSPTRGFSTFAIFATERSAAWAVPTNVTLDASFEETGSEGVDAVRVAVFVIVVAEVTVAVICNSSD